MTELPGEFWCQPIVGCYQDETDGKWVLPSRKTGIWQGNPSEVKYADEIVKAPTPKPTTPKPTTPKPTKSTPKPGGSTGGNSTTNPGTTPGTTPGVVGAPTTEVVPVGAPTAPAAPTVTVKDSDVTVTWVASPNAALETVTGYTLQFTNADPIQLDAATLTHTFTGLKDGNYRAAVQAVNAAGPSLASPPSEVATVGTPISEVIGEVVVDGGLVPGGTVTVTGTKFAKDVPSWRSAALRSRRAGHGCDRCQGRVHHDCHDSRDGRGRRPLAGRALRRRRGHEARR
ncbi:fibronectin type III domain-containing protein [Aeromicrobium sp. UC242_57]|uniref:fibronectin type III domain-containing protein n=1 Tax=Aeromicrobium sp. UC242_57 TaxID=3374624 RepID=UPI0037B13211